MEAYGNMEKGFAGLIYGLVQRVKTAIAGVQTSFGVPVFGYIGDETGGYPYLVDVAKLVFDADFVTSNVITVTVNGVDASTTFDTDHDTTAANLVLAIAALTGVECVLDSADTDNRTFLIRTKGVTNTTTEAITGGSSQATGTVTTGSGQVFIGVSQSTQKEDFYYNAKEAMNVVEENNTIYARVTGAGSAKAKAYLGTDGYFTATAGTDIGCVFVTDTIDDTITGSKCAVVKVGGETQMTYATSFE